MDADRRNLLAMMVTAPLGACVYSADTPTGAAMYGLIGTMRATPGQRSGLVKILLAGLVEMPGNILYVVAEDPADADLLWITEVWRDRASHQASLSLPKVQAAIREARPLIAGMERVSETVPIGGQGLLRPTG